MYVSDFRLHECEVSYFELQSWSPFIQLSFGTPLGREVGLLARLFFGPPYEWYDSGWHANCVRFHSLTPLPSCWLNTNWLCGNDINTIQCNILKFCIAACLWKVRIFQYGTFLSKILLHYEFNCHVYNNSLLFAWCRVKLKLISELLPNCFDCLIYLFIYWTNSYRDLLLRLLQ